MIQQKIRKMKISHKKLDQKINETIKKSNK
jgi:hypothetical protein